MFCYIVCALSLILSWADAESCVTPLGATSQCISLFDCPALTAAFKTSPLPKPIASFLRQSHCGFDANGPTVCCGPLPDKQTLTTTTLRPTTQPTRIPEGPIDPVDESDSYPEPRATCGKDSNGVRIIGGNVTELDEFPWMTMLGYETSKGSLRYECGGALINRRYVLTAAHCLIGPVQEKVGILVTVRLGEFDTEKSMDCDDEICADPPQEIPVQAFYPHAGYDDTNKNRADDIGLVRLTRRATYNDYVQPICLVDPKNTKYDVGSAAVVAGWGKTLSGKKSPLKLKVNLPIYSTENCKSQYSRSFNVQLTERQLCAGGEFAKDSCAGDSGGPLMRIVPVEDIWETIAVVSFGYGCGRDGWPAVYTSIASYLDWIQDKLKETNV